MLILTDVERIYEVHLLVEGGLLKGDYSRTLT